MNGKGTVINCARLVGCIVLFGYWWESKCSITAFARIRCVAIWALASKYILEEFASGHRLPWGIIRFRSESDHRSLSTTELGIHCP